MLVFDTMSLRQISPLEVVLTNFSDVFLYGYNDQMHIEEAIQSVCLTNQTCVVLSFYENSTMLMLNSDFRIHEMMEG